MAAGRTTDPGTRPDRPPKKKKMDRTRQRRWRDRVARASYLSAGCRSWLNFLGSRSNDVGKSVWGAQVRQAEDLNRCERTIRTYRAEAERAGFIICWRSPPEREPETGQWFRRRSNQYSLIFPAKSVTRLLAGHCPSGRKLPNNLPTGVTKLGRAPQRGSRPPQLNPVRTAPPPRPAAWDRVIDPKPPSTTGRDDAAAYTGLAAARTQLHATRQTT